MSEAEHDCENRTALAAIKESAARCRTPMIRQDYESYHFLRYNVIEKNGALNGVRTIVTLIPEQRIGVAVFANKQLTVFPEAVRAELLERVLGPSVGAGPARVRARQQPAWRARVRLSGTLAGRH